MTDDTDRSREDANDAAAREARRRARPAPTIDLKAKDVTLDVTSEASADASHPSQQDAEEAARAAEAVRAAILSMAAKGSGTDGDTPPPAPAAHDGDAPPPPPERKPRAARAVWPLFGAGLAGGALVLFALGALWTTGALAPRDNETLALNETVAALQARLHALESRPAPVLPAVAAPAIATALLERIAKLEAAASAPAPARTGTAPDESALASLTEKLAQLARRDDDLASAVREARGRADAAVTAADAATRNTAARDDLAPLTQRVTALENAVKNQAVAVHAARLLLATQALQNALDRGTPYAAELAAVAALAPPDNAPRALALFADKGLPSAAQLAGDLRALTGVIVAAQPGKTAAPVAEGGGFFDRLQANAERLVSVRRVDETPASAEGVATDPRALLARAQARADKGDIAGARADLQTLPAAMRVPAADWIATAEKRHAALEEARALTAAALAAPARQPS